LEKGVPERRAITLIAEKDGSLGVKDLETAMGKEESSMAIGWLMKKRLARLDKSGRSRCCTSTMKGERT